MSGGVTHGRHRTAKRAAIAAVLPRAEKEQWSVSRVAEEAGVSRATVDRFLPALRGKVIDTAKELYQQTTSRLAQEAQEARAHALDQLQKLRTITKIATERVERMASDEYGNPALVDPLEYGKAVKVAVSASKELLSYTEQVCGIDVVKAITVRTQTAKDGPLVSWDGVESLTKAIEMDIVQDVDTMMQHAPSLPAPNPTKSEGISLDPGWD